MAGLLYFIPGIEKADRAALARLDLGDVFRDRPISSRHTTAGPASGGVVLRPQAPQGVHWPPLGCWPQGSDREEAKQSWEECEGYWVGHYQTSPPTAADLARPEQLAGHEVESNLGTWLVPVARAFPEGSALPQALKLGTDGKWVRGAVLERYAAFSHRAEQFWAHLQEQYAAGEHARYDVLEWMDLVTMALAANYHVNAQGLSHLGLANDAAAEILKAVIDMPTVVAVAAELEKKKRESGSSIPDTSSSSAGGGATPRATPPRSPTSDGSPKCPTQETA